MVSINEKLKKIKSVLNEENSLKLDGPFQVGVDLGTSKIVVVVLDERGEPVSAFLEWADVVRDGIVLDYWQATQIVKHLLSSTEQKLGIEISELVTSYPPGTDPQTSVNVIKASGRQVKYIVDEPSSVSHLLELDEGAVVDIGGGTTGISIVKNGNIVYVADEPTGGRHVTLTIAGNQGLGFEEAERMKLNGNAQSLIGIVQPVFEKMADIVRNHLKGHDIKDVYLSGGTCCFPGIEDIFHQEMTDINIILPYNPLFLTPLAIASYGENGS